jgi:hypothetical protein
MNTKGTPGEHLQRTVSALIMATPWCLIPRFGMSFRCCVEASHVGAAVLARRKIRARVIPCALLVFGPKRDKALSVGLTPETYYRTLETRATPGLPPYDEWLAAGHVTDLHGEEHPIHMVIEAHHTGHRVLIDLTLAQVNKTSAGELSVPPAMRWYDSVGWPEVEMNDGTQIIYLPCPYPDKIPPEARNYKDRELVDDFDASMAIALKCYLDLGRFLATMRPLAKRLGSPVGK